MVFIRTLAFHIRHCLIAIIKWGNVSMDTPKVGVDEIAALADIGFIMTIYIFAKLVNGTERELFMDAWEEGATAQNLKQITKVKSDIINALKACDECDGEGL